VKYCITVKKIGMFPNCHNKLGGTTKFHHVYTHSLCNPRKSMKPLKRVENKNLWRVIILFFYCFDGWWLYHPARGVGWDLVHAGCRPARRGDHLLAAIDNWRCTVFSPIFLFFNMRHLAIIGHIGIVACNFPSRNYWNNMQIIAGALLGRDASVLSKSIRLGLVVCWWRIVHDVLYIIRVWSYTPRLVTKLRRTTCIREPCHYMRTSQNNKRSFFIVYTWAQRVIRQHFLGLGRTAGRNGAFTMICRVSICKCRSNEQTWAL
jgi:hypothetical protein